MQKWASHFCAPRASVPSWINISGPPILFGLYYGFAATSPMGLSHALSMRALIPDRDISGGSVASSLVVGQPVIIPSVYYLRLYVMLVKPHAVTSPVPPHISFYRYRLPYRRLLDKGTLRTTEPPVAMIDRAYTVTSGSITVRVRRSTLLDTIILSPFHHILLLSPVLARLVKLFVSRHSNQFLSVVSSLRGWSGGSIPLKYLAESLAVPKTDSDGGLSEPPVDRSIIHRIFSIIVIASRLSYPGRAPVPVPSRKTRHEFRSDGSIQEFSWLEAWPASVFDYQKGIRPFRYVKDCYNSTSPVKKEIPQYYFHTSVGDGRQRLSFPPLPSLPISGENLEKYVNLSSDIPLTTCEDPLYREWVSTGRRKESDLNNESTNRTEALDNGYSPVEVVDNENGLYDHEKSVFAKIYDPFLSDKLRGRIAGLRSTWLSTHGSDRWIAPNHFVREDSLSRAFARRRRNLRNNHREYSFSGDVKRNPYLSLVTKVSRIHETTRLPCIPKQKPRWVSKPINDLSFGLLNGIRSIKVKSVNYTINNRTGIFKILKRPVPQPDHRRNLVIGSMRARRRKTLVWESLQFRTHSPFFLGMIEKSAPLQSLPGMNAKLNSTHCPTGVGQESKPLPPRATKVTRANRLATAKRWDLPTAHWVRGCLPITQSYLRRNVISPILVTFKNICYPIIFQTNERKEDWNELNREFYVGRNHDGTGGVSGKGLPHQWHREGFQIKIVNPFYLKHRHDSVSRRSRPAGDDNMGINLTRTRNGIRKSPVPPGHEAGSYGYESPPAGGETEYGYSTILGYQTKSPSGDRKKQPSFRKPVPRELGRKWGENILGIRHAYCEKFLRSGGGPNPCGESRNPKELDTGMNESTGNGGSGIEPGEREERYSYGLSGGSSNELSIEFTPDEENCLLAIPPDQSEYRAWMGTKELESLITRGNDRIGRITKPLAGKGVHFGLIGKDRRYPDGSGEPGSIPIHRIIARVRRRRMQLILIRTYFMKVLFRGVDRTAAFIRRFLSVRFDIRLVKRFTRRYVSGVRDAIYLGQGKSRSGTGRNPFLMARDFATGREGRDLPGVPSSRRDVKLVSQAYVSHGIRQLGIVVNKSRPTDLEYWKLNPSTNESTNFVSGEQGILGKGPRAVGGRDRRDKWLQNLRRYNVPPEIWCRIAPRGWKIEVEHRMEDNPLNDSQEKDQSMSLGEAIRGIYSESAPGAKRAGKINRRYKSNLLFHSYLDFAPNSADVRESPGWRMGGGIIPNDHRTQQDIRRNRIVNDGGNIESRMNERKNPHFNSNLHSWLYLEIFKRFHILEMPEFLTTRNPNLMREPNISLISRYAYAGRRGTNDWIETEFWKDRIERRWELGSEQVAARMRKIRDTTNVLRAVSIGSNFEYAQKGIHLESLYESMSRDIALLPYHARVDSTNGMLRDLDHRITGVADDRFLTYRMLSVLFNFQNRFQGVLDLIPYDEFVPRMRILGDGNKTISYSSHIGDVLPPKRRVELRILESLYLEESGDRGTESEEGTSGGNERRNEELLGQNRNTENETQIMKSFPWPGYRPEDPSRMNRFRFDTNNGSRFATLRVCMYPSRILIN
uniref:Protein TIC 214 n=1 Tax=Selaginella rossii TaxID=1834511 RepID=A0A650FHI5_9TRAC|nr:hypothetical chloroplast RF19 [Selaginella rossii]